MFWDLPISCCANDHTLVSKQRCHDFHGWNWGSNFLGEGCKNLTPLLRQSFGSRRIVDNPSFISSNEWRKSSPSVPQTPLDFTQVVLGHPANSFRYLRVSVIVMHSKDLEKFNERQSVIVTNCIPIFSHKVCSHNRRPSTPRTVMHESTTVFDTTCTIRDSTAINSFKHIKNSKWNFSSQNERRFRTLWEIGLTFFAWDIPGSRVFNVISNSDYPAPVALSISFYI